MPKRPDHLSLIVGAYDDAVQRGPPRDGNGPDDRPVIRLTADRLHENVTEAEAALIKAGFPIFSRAGLLVRPVSEDVATSVGGLTLVANLHKMDADGLIDWMSKAARFERFDGRAKDWVATPPPMNVARILHSRVGLWAFPSVVAIITTPTIRRDGSLLIEPGYDPATKLYLAENKHLQMPAMSERPSQAEAQQALNLLAGLLFNFPFETRVDRAVALAGILTASIRGALPVAPLHAIRAHTQGSGKSLLVDVCSVITTGRPAPVVTPGKTEEEVEKRLGSLMLAGVPIVSLDNVNGELGGDLICQMVERPLVRCRPLGKSEMPEMEIRTTTFATGNNLVLRGDMTRRAVVCTLDPGVERPELREFDFDPRKRILADRGAYVAAALTIVRAYIGAGLPDRLPTLGSYEDWSDLVRSALVWLGEADAVESMKTARDDDPLLSAIRQFFGQWEPPALLLGQQYTARHITDKAEDPGVSGRYLYPELNAAIGNIASRNGRLSSHALGRWMARNSGRIVSGRCLKYFPDDKHGHSYMLEEAEG